MIELKLCEPFYYTERCPEVGSDAKVKHFEAMRADGHDVQVRFTGVVCMWRHYVACFKTEDAAALFKLTHL
jgi:hypothetical protein